MILPQIQDPSEQAVVIFRSLVSSRFTDKYAAIDHLSDPVQTIDRTLLRKLILDALRVRPKTCSWITELSKHEADGGEFQECESAAVEIFPILGETTATIEPRNRAFDNPTLGQLYEPLDLRGSFDDFGFEAGQDFGERVVENRSLIGAVGKQLHEEWKLTEQRRQQQDAAVAILNAGGMHDGVQQQAQRIDQNMPLLALDQLAGIEPVRIDAGPPFSALFTLWLSITQAVGLASRPICSRHSM